MLLACKVKEKRSGREIKPVLSRPTFKIWRNYFGDFVIAVLIETIANNIVATTEQELVPRSLTNSVA
jgi:hypothetical protein